MYFSHWIYILILFTRYLHSLDNIDFPEISLAKVGGRGEADVCDGRENHWYAIYLQIHKALQSATVNSNNGSVC